MPESVTAEASAAVISWACADMQLAAWQTLADARVG
jgi:hypothetical protein